MTAAGATRTRWALGPGGGHPWAVRATVALSAVLLLGVAARALQPGSGAGEVRDVVAAVAFTIIGGRVAYRRPANPVGWLFLAVGGTAAAAAFVGASPEGAAAQSWLASWIWWPAYGLLPLALMLFPDGRLPGRRWRGVALLAVVGAVAPTVGLAVGSLASSGDFLSGGPVDPAARPFLIAAAAGMVCAAVGGAAAVAALAQRWRHAVDRDRRQLTWPLAASLAVLVGWVLESMGVPGGWVLGGIAVPVAAAVAIVRHGLYDLDSLLSRTVTYAVLTALLGGLYVLVVVALTRVVTPATGVIVPEAAGALAIAVAFQPVRRRVQQRVDRRFNRPRYDAALAVQGFTSRLREQVELDSLTVELLDVVDSTVQPARRSLWLLPGPATAAPVQADGAGAGHADAEHPGEAGGHPAT